LVPSVGTPSAPPADARLCQPASVVPRGRTNASSKVKASGLVGTQGTVGLRRNEPNVHESRQEPNPASWQGTEMSVTILGNWQYYRAKILKYLRQIAVITPYAQFSFAYVAEDEKNSIRVNFVRRTNKMPKPPKVRICSAVAFRVLRRTNKLPKPPKVRVCSAVAVRVCSAVAGRVCSALALRACSALGFRVCSAPAFRVCFALAYFEVKGRRGLGRR
jgi:hypothetical protein